LVGDAGTIDFFRGAEKDFFSGFSITR
jgi:hypothetical protein